MEHLRVFDKVQWLIAKIEQKKNRYANITNNLKKYMDKKIKSIG